MLDHKDAKHLPHSLYSSATHLPGRALNFRTFGCPLSNESRYAFPITGILVSCPLIVPKGALRLT